MLNTKQRATIEKVCVNTFSIITGSLIIGNLVERDEFRPKFLISGMIAGVLILAIAFWIHRKEEV